MSKLLIIFIKLYQYIISPLLGSRCRFLPSCSNYFIEALQKHNFFKGLTLGLKRISKCHPIKKFGGSDGIDLVPASKKENKNG